jgi:peptidoglycan/LPS O-acetylase OafA/YrhL
MKSPNIKYLPAVDHLRGFAAALIVFYHGLHLISYEMKFNAPFSFSPWPQTNNPFVAVLIEGHTAVALFMVLSGFIFAYGALGRKIAYLPFIRNRFLRIYPLFMVLTLLGLLVYPERFTLFAMLNTIFFRANTAASLPLGAFSAMFWAIAVEFQFYLLFPLLHKIWTRLGGWSLALLLTLALVIKGLVAVNAESVRDLAYFTLVGRMDQFLLGMILAWAYQITRDHEQIMARAFPFTLAAIIALLFGFHKLAGGWPSESFLKIYWPTVEGLVWALVILCYLAAAKSLPDRVSDLLARLVQLRIINVANTKMAQSQNERSNGVSIQ